MIDVVWRPVRTTWVTAVLWLVPTAGFGYALLGLTMFSAYVPMATAACLLIYHGGVAVRGRTELTADGLRNRVWRTRTVRWADVTSVTVEGTAFGEVVSVGGAGAPIKLAGVRTGPVARDPRFEDRLGQLRSRCAGLADDDWRRRRHPTWLFGCALVPLVALTAFLLIAVDKPWRADWWPGVHLAASTPDPCAVFAEPALRAALGDRHPAGLPSDAGPGDRCEWPAGSRTPLALAYDLVDTGSLDARDLAVDAVKLFAGTDRRPVPGLGDEAYVSTVGETVIVRVRVANVVVEVDYDGRSATAVDLARTAAAAVDVN